MFYKQELKAFGSQSQRLRRTLVPAVRPEVFNLSSFFWSVSEPSSQATQLIPRASSDGSARWVSNTSSLRTVILVNLALHLQRCGIKWQQPSRAAGSGVISVDSLTNSLQIQDYVCSSLVRPWDQLTYDAQGRRLGWNIAVMAEQISREYLPQRAPVRTSFTGPAPEGQTSHKIAHLNGEGHPVAFG